MVTKQKVLVVGATGYLGKFFVKKLKSQGYWVRELSRDNQKIEPVKQYVDEVILGEVCVKWLDTNGGEFNIGGPEILTHNEIASQAFEVLEKRPKITYIPLMERSLIVKFARIFTSVKTYGLLEFFMAVLAIDMVAPTYGQHTSNKYFEEISEECNA